MIAEVPTGLFVVHENGIVHPLELAAITQLAADAVSVPLGADPTLTVTLPLPVPAAPLQLTEYVVDAVSDGVVNDPVVPVPPPLGEEHEVALVEVHEMVEVPV